MGERMNGNCLKSVLAAMAWILLAFPAWASNPSVLGPWPLSGDADASYWAAQNSSSAMADESLAVSPKKSERSAGMAVTYALAPGIVLHGAGHFYAGRPWTSAALLLAEAGGIYLACRGGSDIYTAVDSIDTDTFNNFHGDSGQISQGLGLAAGGVMIFLASWLYDLTGAPIALEQSNLELKKNATDSSAPVVVTRLTLQGFEITVESLF